MKVANNSVHQYFGASNCAKFGRKRVCAYAWCSLTSVTRRHYGGICSVQTESD